MFPFCFEEEENVQNKYETHELEQIFKGMYQKSSVTPVFQNTYYSDFKINGINVDFVGPYNIVNTNDLNNFSTLTSKYKRKKLILEKANQKYITVPYLEIMKDINQINTYI